MNSRLNIFLLALFVISACSPRIIENVRTEIRYRDREVRDSLFFRDSIYIQEKMKGDTVYVDKFVYKYIYKDRMKTDTLLREVRDTTFYKVEVEKPLSTGQKIKSGAFWWLILLVVIGFRKELLALIKKLFKFASI